MWAVTFCAVSGAKHEIWFVCCCFPFTHVLETPACSLCKTGGILEHIRSCCLKVLGQERHRWHHDHIYIYNKKKKDRLAIALVRAGEKPQPQIFKPGKLLAAYLLSTISQTPSRQQHSGQTLPWAGAHRSLGRLGWKTSTKGRDESKTKELFMALKMHLIEKML